MIKFNLKKIFTIFIIILPILNIYTIPMINSLRIGEFLGVILILCIITSMIKNDKKLVLINNVYWGYILYLISISLFMTWFIENYQLNETLLRLVRVIFLTLLCFGFSTKYFDYQIGYKVYVHICTICSVFLIIQFIYLLLTGVYIGGILPNMNLSSNASNSTEYNRIIASQISMYKKNYRPSSIFLEPAHFCEYVIYSVPMLLFKRKDKREIIELCINSCAILISRSSEGYILFAVTILFFFFTNKKYKYLTSRYFVLIGIIILLIIISFQFGLIDSLLYRIGTITSSEATTGSLRVLRGFVVFSKLPFIFKLFGIGAGNYNAFIMQYEISTIYDKTVANTNEFMNGISVVLVFSGIIGLLIYGLGILKVWMKTNKYQKSIFLIFLLIMFSSNIFFKATYILPLIFIVVDHQGLFDEL